MKRILIRAGMTPFDNYDAAEMLLSFNNLAEFGNNMIGGNNGNMLYAYSVMRTLMKDESYTIEADHYMPENYIASDERIEYVNANYDLYVIPLANAFRDKFRFCLMRLTDFIERINIPVVVIGIGVGKVDDVEKNKEIIIPFIKAVLKKSAMIGVRGEMTLKALASLGFIPEQDVTAIGCPSAYTFGPTIKLREPKIGRFSKMVFNDNIKAKEQVHDFMYRTMKDRKNAWFLPQMINELKEVYVGASTVGAEKVNGMYPTSIDHPYYSRGNARFFINIPTWMEFVSDAGFSIGSRMHGNVVPVLNGTPSMFIVIDSRMRDMVRYHHYPHILQKDIDENTTLEQLVEKTDYTKFYKYQQRNFDHYLDFLRLNGISSIYDDGTVPKRGEAPFDKKIAGIDFHPGVTPINKCSLSEMTERWNSYFPRETESIDALRGKAKTLLRKNEGAIV